MGANKAHQQRSPNVVLLLLLPRCCITAFLHYGPDTSRMPPLLALAAFFVIALSTVSPAPPAATASVPNPQTAPAARYLANVTRWADTTSEQPAGLTPTQIHAAHAIRRAFRPLGRVHLRTAIRVAWRESRLTPTAVNHANSNGTSDWGLFQLNDGGTLQTAGGDPSNPRILTATWNAQAAARLVTVHDWVPWGGRL